LPLPIDPAQPGITAVTRPIGSINSKNGATVELLHAGESVTADELIELADRMIQQPFRTVLKILSGAEQVTPCPRCGKESLAALDHVGHCYGCKKRVSLTDLYEVVFATPSMNGEVTHV
jgi:hypothetical protein